ncbi:transposase family protein [Nocardiopsis dassonvillei]|uniref:transposase family protein n=1 Tax=Nocardiopsis dassonvillei TaxID=2014 RepID=UPI003F563BE8
MVLDGTPIACDRLARVRDNGNDLWFSQKHKSFGGNIQFLAVPDGTPLWVSGVESGSTPDITAARIHVLPALYKAAADGLPKLADKGSTEPRPWWKRSRKPSHCLRSRSPTGRPYRLVRMSPWAIQTSFPGPPAPGSIPGDRTKVVATSLG